MAEDAGWDGFFLEDFVVHWSAPDAAVHDPWVCLASVALATERIRIGLAVTPLARRRPWIVARQAVTLDHLSRGRMVLGVGLGTSTDADIARFGEIVDDRARAAALDEALAVVAGLWTGEPF